MKRSELKEHLRVMVWKNLKLEAARHKGFKCRLSLEDLKKIAALMVQCNDMRMYLNENMGVLKPRQPKKEKA